MRAFLILFLFLTAGSCGASAQDLQSNIPQNSSEGTWQIQVINSRSQPFIPGNIDQLVAENRHATNVVYVKLGSEVRLKILPLSEINKPEFIPLEKIAHITE